VQLTHVCGCSVIILIFSVDKKSCSSSSSGRASQTIKSLFKAEHEIAHKSWEYQFPVQATIDNQTRGRSSQYNGHSIAMKVFQTWFEYFGTIIQSSFNELQDGKRCVAVDNQRLLKKYQKKQTGRVINISKASTYIF